MSYKLVLEEKTKKHTLKREIITWRIFEDRISVTDYAAIVLFKTTNGQLRATIGIWKEDDENAALDIAVYGERLRFEEAYPFFAEWKTSLVANVKEH